MFLLTVTQRGDVCHVKWKHRALCFCFWIENWGRFLWKCSYHPGHCSQDPPSHLWGWLNISVICFFISQGKSWTQHEFLLQSGLSRNHVAPNPPLSDRHLSRLLWIFWEVFCKITRTVHHICYHGNIYFVRTWSVYHLLALMYPPKSLRV